MLDQVEKILSHAIGRRESVERAPRRAERLALLDRVVRAAADLESALAALDEVTLSELEAELGEEGNLVEEARAEPATFARALAALARATRTRDEIAAGADPPPRNREEARDEAAAQIAALFREATGAAKGDYPAPMLDFVQDVLIAAELPCPEDLDMLRRLLRAIERR